MLIDLDQNTLANMTAALEYVCKKIPGDKDSPELRKKIANAITACASSGRRTLIDFQDAGFTALKQSTQRTKSTWAFWR
jgi:hypothetical protein